MLTQSAAFQSRLEGVPQAENIHMFLFFSTDESGEVPGWNFFKYLLDHTGKVVGRWGPWSDLEEIWHTIRGVVEDAVAADKHGEEAPAQTTTDHKAPAPPKEQTRQPVHDTPPSHDDL